MVLETLSFDQVPSFVVCWQMIRAPDDQFVLDAKHGCVYDVGPYDYYICNFNVALPKRQCEMYYPKGNERDTNNYVR